MSLVHEVLDAHGGIERWERARCLRLRNRAGGFLLATRARGLRGGASLEIGIGDVVASAVSDSDPKRRHVFERGAVRIETLDGDVLAARPRPRPCFFGRAGLRRNLRWDELDCAYFAGYAWWNYLNAPYLFVRDGVSAVEVEPWAAPGGETWRRLEVRFPTGLDTHSPVQTFYYDDELRLRRHDYVAEVVGSWARAAHLCEGHVEIDGMRFPTRRHVHPIGPRNRPLAAPTLVALQLSGIEVE